MLMKISQFFFQREKLKNNFFEGFEFNLKSTRNNILHWIYNLYRYEEIKVEKFLDLFVKYDKIIFPVKVQSYGRDEVLLLDSKGEEYYFMYSIFGCISGGYLDMKEYIIGKRKYPYDEDFIFKFLPHSGKILLKQRDIIMLKEDDTNLDNTVSFKYDYKENSICVVFKNNNIEIKVKYPSKKVNFDNKLILIPHILNSLYDVKDITLHIKSILQVKTLNIKSFSKLEVLSEINIVDDVVTFYSFTKQKDEFITCYYKINKKSSIDEFFK